MRTDRIFAFWRITLGLLILSVLFMNPPAYKAATSGPALWSVFYAGEGAWKAKLYDMAIDKTGNIILAGAVWQANQPDFVTLKYSKSGELLWENKFNSPASINDEARAVVVDTEGNVYVTGFSATRASYEDYYTIKYSSEGTLIWEARHNGPGNQPDIATALVLQGDYLYITGHSVNGTGAYVITTIKYAAADGSVVWKKNHAGHSTSAISADSQGNIYVAGVQSNDSVIVKYAPDGSEIWTGFYDSPDGKVSSPKAMILDKDENILFIGNAGKKIVVVKMAPDSAVLWAQQFGGASDVPSTPGSITLDGEGNVYACGSGWMDSDADYGALTHKYSPEGNLLWEASYNGHANDLVVDPDGEVYVAASSAVDRYSDSTVLKYSSQGSLRQVLRYRNDDNRSYGAFAIGLDKFANLIVGGGINTDQEILLVKYGPNPGPVLYLEDVIVTEGNSSKDAGDIDLYVRLNAAMDYDVSVDYRTISGSANPGEDFKSSQGTLLIERGNAQSRIELSIVGDTLPETDELFYVDFSAPTNATLFTSRAYLTIREDDRNLQRWVVRYDNPPGIDDIGSDLAVDPDGNLILIGTSSSGSVRYDRLFKYDPDGDLVWERIVAIQDKLLALDQPGNIYLAGGFESDEMILSKYDSQGSLKWDYLYPGPNGHHGHLRDLAIDPGGNIIVAGSYIVSGDESDAIIGAFTMKFDPQGNLIWSREYGTTRDDWGGAEKVGTDRGGNVLIARESITPAGRYVMVLKYSPDGDLLMTAKHHYTGYANPVYDITDMQVGSSGHVYLAAQAYNRSTSFKVLIIKFSPSGSVLWENSAFYGNARSIALDQSGNVYATGSEEYDLVKISPAGDTLWMKNVDMDVFALGIGPSGKIYLTGSRMSTETGQDYATNAFDPDGTVLWREYYHGTGAKQGASEYISALAIDDQENVYVTGQSQKDIATIKYGQPSPQLVRILDTQIVEGDSQTKQARFSVQLEAPLDFDLSVYYTTISQSAIAGVDFESVSGTLTIPAGAERAVIEVPVLSDDEPEGSETFQVKLSEPSAGGFADSLAVGTILDEGTRFQYLPAVVLVY